MNLLRHGGVGRLFDSVYAPSTLGSFLRAFTFGHVRQLDAVASRFLIALAGLTGLLPPADPIGTNDTDGDGGSGWVLVDVDDSIVEVHGHAKQGAGYGYTRVRGLNMFLATASVAGRAPVVVAQRLRKGSAGSPRGAKRLVADALATVRRITGPGRRVLFRADSAFYGHATIAAAMTGGADVSVTVRLNPAVQTAIGTISDNAWTPIEYTDAVFDEDTQQWISRAEVAEIPFTAFAGQKKAHRIPGRLVVRRIPDVNAEKKKAAGQEALFDLWRFHAFFTTTDKTVHDMVTADQIHRRHAIIEQIHADLKDSAIAHLPSGKFTANAAWLTLAVIAHNLTRAAAVSTTSRLARARTATIRRTLIHLPARISTTARRITLHLPHAWPWQTAWTTLYTHVNDPPPPTPAT